ncbi:MAG TPA: hypothetical protein PKD05_25135, partial [Candidatus Melainabacteria bacterium]|nr:hypothetical protein [Candidatus Melainabacteria bacterium]
NSNTGFEKPENLTEVDTKTAAAQKALDEMTPEERAQFFAEKRAELGDKPEVKEGKIDCPECTAKAGAHSHDGIEKIKNGGDTKNDVPVDKTVDELARKKGGTGDSEDTPAERKEDVKEPEEEGDKLPEAKKEGDKPPEAKEKGSERPKADDTAKDAGDANDSSLREIDPEKDKREAVEKRFAKMATDAWGDTPETQEMIKSFSDSLDVMEQAKANGDMSEKDLQTHYRALNIGMDGARDADGNKLTTSKQDVNATVGHARKLEDIYDGENNDKNGGKSDPRANAFAQGDQGTCGSVSSFRVEAKNDPTNFSNEFASIRANGGAFRGGQDGKPATFHEVDKSAFYGDSETNQQWNEEATTMNGRGDTSSREMTFLVGQEYADLAENRDRASGRLGADESYVFKSTGQNGQDDVGMGTYRVNTETGENVSRKDKEGNSDGGKVSDGQMSSLDMHAVQAHRNGRTVFMHESFKEVVGAETPGVTYFANQADLNQQLNAPGMKGKEHQIITNGALLLGRNEHGLHAQVVRADSTTGETKYGNNWT